MPTYIGKTNDQFENGVDYSMQTQDMTGKIFKPGKTPDGKKWLDVEGKKDERIMMYGGGFYHVFNSPEEILKDWKFDNQTIKFHSPRIQQAFHSTNG